MSRSIDLRSAIVGGLISGLVMTALPVVAGVGDTAIVGQQNKSASRATTFQGLGGKGVLRARSTRNNPALDLQVNGNAAPMTVDSTRRVKNLNADMVDGRNARDLQVLAAHAGGDQHELITSTEEVVRSVSLTAPTDGVVVVNSSAYAAESTSGDDVVCSITTGTALDSNFAQQWSSSGGGGNVAPMAGTRAFDVPAGEVTFNLVCAQFGDSADAFLSDSALTAIFIPNS